MRILHTSDWHIGRAFHGHSTLPALRQVFDALIREVREQGIDVVLGVGDIFDSSTPSGEAVEFLDSVLLDIRAAGAEVVIISGNHDSPARLGAKAAFAHAAGIHILTGTAAPGEPVTIADEHGPVHFYGIPFLEPARMRTVWTDAESMRTQRDAVGYALARVREDAGARGGRTVVLAHTFVSGAESESSDSERDIASREVGGVDKVAVSAFDGVHYAALGHIHGRATLSETVRYSGAPLHYSFSEASKRRGGWLVELDATGLGGVEWLDLPVPRPLSSITGTLEELLTHANFETVTDHWISATLTDTVRPLNAMPALQARFPHCTHLQFRPNAIAMREDSTYAALVKGKSDDQLIDAFLAKVRNGEGLTAQEADVIADVLGTSAQARRTA